MAEGLHVDVPTRSVESNGRHLRPAGFQEHPVGTGCRSTCLQSGKHDAAEPASAYAFAHKHASDLGWPPRASRHAWDPEAPAAHGDGLTVQVADEERSVRWRELGGRKRRIVRPPVDRHVEL